MNSVKTKIIALVVCCIVLASVAIGGTGIINSRRVVAEDSVQTMNLLCDNRKEQLNSLFLRIEQSVETLTVYTTHQLDDSTRFKTDAQYVKQFSDSLLEVAINSAENTEGAMAVYIRYNPEFTDPESGIFCTKSTSDNMFKPLPPTNLADYDADDREHVAWFYEPAQKKTGTWVTPYHNENIDVEMISYVVPFYVNNSFIGVVGMDINFTVLQEIIYNTEIYKTGYAFLTNDKAQIVYHKSLPRGTDLVEYSNGEFRQVAELLKNNTSNHTSLVAYTFGGVPKEAAFRTLSNDMRLILTAPVSEIDAQANMLLLQMVFAVLIIVLLAVILTIVFTRKLVRPLLELTVAAKKIADGDLSVSITHQSGDEVGALAESFRQTVAHLHKYISYINELAYRDSLTGVKNKTAYLEIINRMEEATRLKRSQYAVIVFDINDLKTVNDHLGHDFGDMLIISACKIICRVFQRSPIYRIGGDEFVALLENTDLDHYAQLLEEFERELEEYNRQPSNELKVSIARGIAIYSEDSDLTYNDVFKRADNAMYHNKAEMKNRSAQKAMPDGANKDNQL